jgi:formylglycine-generating enzyme required for sulfatase activity
MADPNQETPEALQARIAELERQLAAVKAVLPPRTGGQRNIGIGGDATGNIIFSGDRNIGSVEQLRIESAIFPTPPSAGQVEPRVLLWQYLNQVVTDTATLSLTGVDRKTATDKEEARLELAAVYTQLDTLMRERCGYIDVGLSQPSRLMAERETRQSVLAFVQANPCAALLGDPGSGKTTFSNFLALALAGEMLGLETANLRRLGEEWSAGALLPVRVVLRDFAAQLDPASPLDPGDQLWEFIQRKLGGALTDFAPLLRRHLLTQGGLLLLDGLDEVPETQRCREFVKQAVLGFRRQFSRVRVLLTSRTYAYQRQEWRLPGFAEAVIAPFTPEQIERFIDRWYAHVAKVRANLAGTEAAGRASLLKIALKTNPHLGELAQRPLLLTLMASLHAWRGGSLPEGREELYEQSVELLLDVWERPKVVHDRQGRPVLQTESAAEWFNAPQSEVRKALEEIAFEAHQGQPEQTGAADIPEERLVAALLRVAGSGVHHAQVLEYIRDRAGLIINRGERVYSFPHRTFQEYLAARHLTVTAFPAKLVELVRADPERWREVLLLAGAKVARGTPFAAWSLIGKLCPEHCAPTLVTAASDNDYDLAMLAGRLLLETRIGLGTTLDADDRRKLENVRAWLAALVAGGHLPPADRAAAGVALGKLGDPRKGVGLRGDGVPDIDWVTVQPGPFVMGAKEGTWSGEKATPQFNCQLIRQAYRLSRYPVTVAQYQAFVEGGGYEEAKYWTEAGWQRRQSENGDRPDDYDELNQAPNHPRVGVNWYEAVAFCRWLGERLGFEVSLPTEAQWERAARHTDGRTYPWGEAEDVSALANVEGTGIGSTSAVGMFPQGKAECGALDMAGNVWEWCRTKMTKDYKDYERKVDDDLESEEARVLRGGAWSSPDDLARCSDRLTFEPDLLGREPDLLGRAFGFRVVAPPFDSGG